MTALPGMVRLPYVTDQRAQRNRLALCILVSTLLIWGLVDVRRRGVIDPANLNQHKTDLTVYTEAGAAFFDGREPYQVTNVRGWGYLYPPLFAMLMAPLSALPPTEQVLTWFLLSLLTVWGCVHEIRRLCVLLTARQPVEFRTSDGAAPRAWPAWIWYAASLAVLLPTLNCLQRGQVGVLLLYLLLLGWRLCLEGRTALSHSTAGVVLAASIVLKVTPLLPVACLCGQMLLAASFHSQRRAQARLAWATTLGVLGGVALFALLVPASLIGWDTNTHHLQTWWTLVGTKAGDPGYDNFAGDSHTVRNQSLSNAAQRFGNWAAFQVGAGPDDRAAPADGAEPKMPMDAPLAKQTLLATRLLLLALLAWPMWTTVRRQDRLGQAATVGLACVATLVASPISRGHYFMLLLPAVLLVPAWLNEAGRTRAAQQMAWSAVALVMAHYLLMRFTGRIGLLGIGITVWYVAAVVLVARGTVPQAAAARLPVRGTLARQHVAA